MRQVISFRSYTFALPSTLLTSAPNLLLAFDT
jgi:hypothetical protein